MSATTATLIPLETIDPAEIELLLDRAFGSGRHLRTAYQIRQGRDWLPGLSFAALDEEERLAGTIQAFPVALTDRAGRAHPLIMVGPIAVAPERQDQGFGRAMLATQTAAIDPRAPLPQVLIGDAPYYEPFGFTAAHTGGWRCPGPWDPARLLVRCENPAVLPEEGMLGPWRG
jgi:predicted N-acetyltransferase YhbS